MPAIDPEIGASLTGFDAAEVKPRDEIPSPVSLIEKSSLITPPTGHDMGSRPMELGEPSFGPSVRYAKKVLKSVLSS